MNSRVFRVFLSSTFGDFQVEREVLRQQVWPRLQRFCKIYGASFEAVDLRWGISESDAVSQETLRICLDEIAHCQNLSPKPNFLMLLGDRYGWRPLPNEIPVDEFNALLAVPDMTSESKALLMHWYQRDDNATPPQFRLLSRDVTKKQADAWPQVETDLLTVLRRAAQKLGLTAERRERYFLSATHLEIIRGALAVSDADQHVVAFFRHIDGLALAGNEANSFTDAQTGVLATDIAELRGQLWQEISRKIPEAQRFTYHCQWLGDSHSPLSKSHLEEFCANVEESLRGLIEKELMASSGDELAQEIESHDRFAQERAAIFVGRIAEMHQLDSWYMHYNPSANATVAPLFVHGVGGVGKSSFLARAVVAIKGSRPNLVVIQRFIGSSPRSLDLHTLLADLLAELAQAYDQPGSLPAGCGMSEMIDEFPRRLAWASAERPLVLVLDAFDQLRAALETQLLQWLPSALPPHVALLVSVLDGPALQLLRQRFPVAGELNIPGLSSHNGATLLKVLLQKGTASGTGANRCLQPQQQKSVLDAFGHDQRPLYLVLAASIARRWPSWHRAVALPTSLEALVASIIDSLRADHGAQLINRAMGYLVSSRHGLSDEEMRDLLWRDAQAHAEFNLRKNPNQPEVDALPLVIWSRIYFALAPYLSFVEMNGALLHRFFHRIIGEQIAGNCLGNEGPLLHSRIADYFQQKPLFVTDLSQSVPNLRKLMEEPWQRIQAQEWYKAEALLTDFGFVMAACQANRIDDLMENLTSLLTALASREIAASECLVCWDEFIRSRSHLLRRGNANWGAHKILLQLAIEHADNSPVTGAAQAWLDAGNCDWFWLRNMCRLPALKQSACRWVFEGHNEEAYGTSFLSSAVVASWTPAEIRLWSTASGALLGAYHSGDLITENVESLPNGRILIWSTLRTTQASNLRLWDEVNGNCLVELAGIQAPLLGMSCLSDNSILAWDKLSNFYHWSAAGQLTKDAFRTYGHLSLLGACVHDSRLLVAWYDDASLRVWDLQKAGQSTVFTGHTGGIVGAAIFGTQLLSWGTKGRCVLWDLATASLSRTFTIGSASLQVAVLTDDGKHLFTCAEDGCLRFTAIDPDGASFHVQAGIGFGSGAALLSDGRFVAWGGGGLAIWDCDTGQLVKLEDHTQMYGAHIRPNGIALSWGWEDDCLIRLWDLNLVSTNKNSADDGMAGKDIAMLPDGSLFYWTWSNSLVLMSPHTHQSLLRLESAAQVTGVTVFGEYLYSWDTSGCICKWDWKSGQLLARMQGHEKPIIALREIAGERLASWAQDQQVRLWNAASGECLCRLDSTLGAPVAHVEVCGTRLLAWDDNGEVAVWELQGQQLIGSIANRTYWFFTANLDDANLVTQNGSGAKDAGLLSLWDIRTGKLLSKYHAIGESVMDMHAMPKNGLLLAYSNKVFLLSMPTWGTVLELNGQLQSVAKDGRFLVRNADTLTAYDAVTGKSIWHSQRTPKEKIWASWNRGARVIGQHAIWCWEENKTIDVFELPDVPGRAPRRYHINGTIGLVCEALGTTLTDETGPVYYSSTAKQQNMVAIWNADKMEMGFDPHQLSPGGVLLNILNRPNPILLKLFYGSQQVLLPFKEGISRCSNRDLGSHWEA